MQHARRREPNAERVVAGSEKEIRANQTADAAAEGQWPGDSSQIAAV